MITKKKLREYLEEKGIYNDVDEFLIDDFIAYLEMSQEARRDIKKRGAVMNIAKPENKPYYQQNPSVSILNNATKNLLNISRKLALSPYDRAKLKVEEDIEDDGFNT
ncbi:P27 family phage terminase small subunit [Gaoshiqia sediminis]|uniref:P27 family phage terminase small subunit n=1 Tax=Gaoshiqia sediminis TaxID=2986998 RepID=A0AA42C8F9_9BACT|nr:P27 family phage terminase small subunit [Gaoshiqia sediminis]MCW0484669.1 P27 family phage terminase small subunit [Gaoshiqia sediminis]